MATKNILTYNAKVSSVEEVYYAPVAVVPPYYSVPLSSLYCFLSKVDPWLDDNNPPTPTQDQKYIKQVFKNMFVAKQILSNEISPVIERIDWTSRVFDYYRDDIDMFALDNDKNLALKFYVRNKYDQIFKCLWNNNRSVSTVEPYFEPGTYGTNNIFKGSDGYKWKYIYTIDSGLKLKFMDNSWMPISVGANTPNPLVSSAGCGNIDVINVTNGGSGYDLANAVINITITGDGVGATATVLSDNIVDGIIKDVSVTSTGTNYTYANVTITSGSGSGAVAYANTSPVGGHGFDPVSELGASHVMFAVEFNGSENENIPIDITYHQLGVVINPTTQELSPLPANGAIYKTTTDLIVAPGFGVYMNDEVVYQGNSLDTATFVGTILSFDPAANLIRLINTTGSLTTNAPVYGYTSQTTRTLLSYNTPIFTLFSGYMSYIENRSGITRSADGIEQFKLVLGY
jgi:hypothetical protein